MAFRSDITVDFLKSPRLIRIPNTSDEVTQQDLYDTLRQIEDDIGNASYDSLIDGAGKEPLGGGTLVGITNELQNAVLFFVPDTTVIESGTITTADATGITLIDNVATFITNGVTAGAMVVNFTDQSIASVISIDSETQLTCEPLGGGTDDEFGLGDAYKIWNVIQKDVTGGNLVAIDDLGADISPILPSAATQVRTTASSSATLQEQLDVQFASFNGGVTVDITSSYDGDTFPVGTGRAPVNNIPDAVSIANQRGFRRLYIVGNITLDTGDNIDDFVLEGEDPDHSLFTVNTGASTINTAFENATIQGTLDGGSFATDCHIENLNFVDGSLHDCQFNGTITLSGSNDLHAINCVSGVIGTATPTINMGGSGSGLALRNYNGGIKLSNKTGSESCSLDINSGQVIIDSDVTNGRIVIRGITKVTDNSTGTAIVDIADAVVPANITSLKYQIENLRPSHLGYGRTFYMDPVNGDDTLDGLGPSRAVKTFSAAHGLVTDGAGDIIYILSPGAGTTTIDERWTITKSNLSIRGPGRDILLKPSVADLGDTITIDTTALGVELSGFIVEAATGTTIDDAIVVKAKFSYIHSMWINRAIDGVSYRGGDYHRLSNCEIERHSAHGVYFQDDVLSTGSPREVTVENCNIYLNGGDGIHLTGVAGSSTRINRFWNNRIHDNTGYGIVIDAEVDNTTIGFNIFHSNTAGRLLNNGTNTHDEIPEARELVVDAVWDELATDHTTADTFGRRIAQLIAKINATIGLS